MRILLDNNVTQQLAPWLVGHEVIHAREMGWADLSNGDLVRECEQNGFEVLLTADKGMLYQQNITGRAIGILLLRSYRITFKHLAPLVPLILEALANLTPGEFRVVASNPSED